MSGWSFYRLGAGGGACTGGSIYWHLVEREKIGDPFHDSSNGAWRGIPYGDPFVIYPGEQCPIDSIRWEVFAESLEDYAVLQTSGITRGDPLLAEIRSYADFPKTEDWIRGVIDAILQGGMASRAR